MKEFIECITKKYAYFRGRAGRREYWMFTLIETLLFAPMYLYVIYTLEVNENLLREGDAGFLILQGMILLFILFMLIPSLAVAVRRLHDTGRCWAWLLAGHIPAVGMIIFVILTCLPGTEGTNKYGPDPRAE